MIITFIGWILAAILLLLVIFLIGGFVRTVRTQNSPQQKAFLKGTIPAQLPDGFYKGHVPGHTAVMPWLGKEFHGATYTGINIVSFRGKKAKQYPFKTYVGKGLLDKHLDVIKIDYNFPQNPFVFRPILDEIVETEKGKYIGKVHYQLIPGMPFSLGYFYLEKDNE